MKKPQFSKVYQWVITAALALILGVTANYIADFNIFGQYAFIIRVFGALLLLIAIVQFLWWAIEKVSGWVKTPNRKNIKLSLIRQTDEDIFAQICNKEWRSTVISVKRISVWYRSDLYKNISSQPISLQRWRCQPVKFMSISSNRNKFYFTGEERDQSGFGYGTYEFSVCVEFDITISKHKESGNLKWYDVMVTYKEPNQISLEIKHADKL